MKTLAFVFSYNRPETLRACLDSISYNSDFIPDEGHIIDDCSPDPEVKKVIHESGITFKTGSYVFKDTNRGLGDSAQMALKRAREANPDFVFFIEGDYVFRRHGLDCVLDCLTNTPEGDSCLGIAGYDHPNQRDPL